MCLKCWINPWNSNPSRGDDTTFTLLQDLIHHCLTIDPNKRPMASELLSHPLFTELHEIQKGFQRARRAVWEEKSSSLSMDRTMGVEQNPDLFASPWFFW